MLSGGLLKWPEHQSRYAASPWLRENFLGFERAKVTFMADFNCTGRARLVLSLPLEGVTPHRGMTWARMGRQLNASVHFL